MRSSEILVGIDGSPQSEDALRWAAAEARRRQCDLLVLYVYDWHLIGTPTPLGAPFVVDAKGDAEATVTRAAETARQLAPEVTVRAQTVLARVAPTLVSASANGATIVVGNRGRGGFASLLLGSVSQQVALHAHGPVVVVRGRTEPDHGPVLVGVDGSDAGNQALRVALDEAIMRGTGVFAVRAYPSPLSAWGPDVPVPLEDPEERRHAVQTALDADVEPWREKYPDVEIGCAAIEGHPGEVLVGLSVTARLVVVGNRGHGGLSGLLLGSVGMQLLHHADCPVLIARAFES